MRLQQYLHAFGAPDASSAPAALPFPSSAPSTNTIPDSSTNYENSAFDDSSLRGNITLPFLKEDLFRVTFLFKDLMANVAL